MCNEVLHHCARGWDTSAPRVAVPTPQCRALLLKVSSCVSSPWLQAGAWDDDLGFVGTAKSQARKYRLGGNFVCKCREFFDSETNRIYANALWCARARIPAHICTNICTSIHPSIHKSIHPSIHPSIHSYPRAYVRMYVHTCMQVFIRSFFHFIGSSVYARVHSHISVLVHTNRDRCTCGGARLREKRPIEGRKDVNGNSDA